MNSYNKNCVNDFLSGRKSIEEYHEELDPRGAGIYARNIIFRQLRELFEGLIQPISRIFRKKGSQLF